MRHSLKTKLSFAIAIIVLLTVALISFLANLFIEEQFNDYITRQQKQKMGEIVSSLSQQYNKNTDSWNLEYIHTIGMAALYDGYIIQVSNIHNESIWDAKEHDMSLCEEVMEDIAKRMEIKYPKIDGEITMKTFPIVRSDETLGSVDITYFGPYFLNENDFKFLDALKIVLLIIGLFSLLFSIFMGILMAKRLSRPILKTVDATKQIADGNYGVRIDEDTDTKEMNLLTTSINQLAEALERQENLRKQLTEDVSHELRTPIAIVQSHIEAMIEGVWEPSLERLKSCNDEIIRIGGLVRDIENLTKIDSENLKLHKTMVNLFEIIDKALKGFEVKIKEKNLKVSIDGHCPDILADRDRISQVVMNLLSNAIKYSQEGGEIYIQVLETLNSIVLRIQDNGNGIPENELPFIFERFYRADKSRNRKTGGLGLGLAIVNSIVEAHGGKVSVENQVNKGSCFEVMLPK